MSKQDTEYYMSDERARTILQVIIGTLNKSLDLDDWVKKLSPQFNTYLDFENKLFSLFSTNHIFLLPSAFWFEIDKIESFSHFVELVKEELSKRKYFSVGINRSFGGLPRELKREIEIRDEGEITKAYKLILQHGILTYKPSPQTNLFSNDIKQMETGLTPFDKKFYDFLIIHMAPDATVPIFSKYGEMLKILEMPDNGRSWSMITNSAKKFANIEWECLIELPPLKKETKKKFIGYPPEPMLKFPYFFEEQEDGSRKRKTIVPIPSLLSLILQLKAAGNYLVEREIRLLSLPPVYYNIVTSLHEMFRLNITSPEYKLNLDSLLNLFAWTFAPRTEKRSLKNLHNIFDDLKTKDHIGEYHITENKKRLQKDWYNLNQYKLTKRNTMGKRETNRDLFKTIIYNFTIPDSFIKRHENIYKKRLQFRK